MARYCFYCGRELTAGEKCNCRNKEASQDTQAASAKYQAGSRVSSKDSIFKRFIRFFNPFVTSAGLKDHHQRKASGPRNARTAHTSGRGGIGNSASTRLKWQNIRSSFMQMGQYLVRPSDGINKAAEGSVRQPVILVLVIKGIIGGVLLLNITHQTFLQSLLALNIVSPWENSRFSSSFSIFTQGFAITLLSSMFLALLYFLALRFLFRRPAGFYRVLLALCPSFFYMAIFLFISLLTLEISIFNAGMLLLAGFAVSALAHFLAMRQFMGFDDNRSLLLVVLVQVLFSGILAGMLNMTLPLLRALIDQSGVI